MRRACSGLHFKTNLSRTSVFRLDYQPLFREMSQRSLPKSLLGEDLPLSHGSHIVPGDQESFVLPRQASPPWFPLRGLEW